MGNKLDIIDFFFFSSYISREKNNTNIQKGYANISKNQKQNFQKIIKKKFSF